MFIAQQSTSPLCIILASLHNQLYLALPLQKNFECTRSALDSVKQFCLLKPHLQPYVEVKETLLNIAIES
jgi:hypothetical protein